MFFRKIISKIRHLLGIEDPKELAYHPKYDKTIEYGFTSGGTHYYKLKNHYDIFQDRAAFMLQFSTEMDMRLTSDMLNEFMDKIIELTKIKDGEVDLGGIQVLAKEIKYRQEWLFEPESLYRMASVMWFDLKEDITTYDWQYNKEKIDSWKKKEEVLPYLCGQLLDGQNPFLSLSHKDSQLYLRKLREQLERQQTYLSKQKVLRKGKPKQSKTSGSVNI